MGASLKLVDTDHGWEELKREVARMADHHVLVGVQGAEAAANYQGTGLTIAQIGSVHEFGRPAINIPERSFIRAGIDEHRERILNRCTRMAAGIMGRVITVEQALGLLGEYTVGLLKARIARGIEPPNRPSTIRRKGSSKPLIDTGQLRNSITYAIERGA
jgi:hypothetical protein